MRGRGAEMALDWSWADTQCSGGRWERRLKTRPRSRRAEPPYGNRFLQEVKKPKGLSERGTDSYGKEKKLRRHRGKGWTEMS